MQQWLVLFIEDLKTSAHFDNIKFSKATLPKNFNTATSINPAPFFVTNVIEQKTFTIDYHCRKTQPF